MNSKDNSGPAFPGLSINNTQGNVLAPDGQLVGPGATHSFSGMTLRTYIATHALAAMLVDTDNLNKYEAERAAQAVAHADALLAELAQ